MLGADNQQGSPTLRRTPQRLHVGSRFNWDMIQSELCSDAKT